MIDEQKPQRVMHPEPKLILVRDIQRSECPWLMTDLPAGTTVYAYMGATYGCVSRDGLAVTQERGLTPFFELPRTALAKEKGA